MVFEDLDVLTQACIRKTNNEVDGQVFIMGNQRGVEPDRRSVLVCAAPMSLSRTGRCKIVVHDHLRELSPRFALV